MKRLPDEDVIAMLTFWTILVNADCDGPVGMPDWFVCYNSKDPCDMAWGPCSCGAWHKLGEQRKGYLK